MSDNKSSQNTTFTVNRGVSIAQLLMIIVILAAAAAAVFYLIKTKPKPDKKPPMDSAALVEVIETARGDYTAVVNALGQVIPAREITLYPQVGGEVISVDLENLIPGKFFTTGQEILKIDPADYELAIKRLEAELNQKKAAIISSQSNLDIEKGKQLVAKQEMELFGEDISGNDAALALRKPQLLSAEADLNAAKAASDVTVAQLDAAKLDLKRTSVTAPFNCVVRQKFIDTGSQLGTNSQIADLVCTDEFWVELNLPASALKWIGPDGQSAAATITNPATWEDSQSRSGKVISIAAELETAGRLAKAIVAVKDPLSLNGNLPKLLLGDYVHVAIQGRELKDVIRIAESALRENSSVWIMADDKTLEIRKVEPIWKDSEYVYLENSLKAGEKIVVSQLTSPVENMKLRIKGDKPAQAKINPENAKVEGESKKSGKKGNK